MNSTFAKDLILSTLADFGTAVVTILTAVIAVGVAYLVFRFGWKGILNSLDGGDSDSKWTRGGKPIFKHQTGWEENSKGQVRYWNDGKVSGWSK